MTDFPPLTPDPEQEAAIQRILREPTGGAIVAGEVGTGKTLILTEVGVRSWAGRVLIIGPVSGYGLLDLEDGLLKNWVGTVYRQSNGAIQLRRCSKKNKAEMANLDALLSGEPGWYYIGRELFARMDWSLKDDPKRPGKRKKVWHHIWKKLDLDLAVYDEVQFAVEKNSNGRKSWTDVNAKIKVACSADWFGNQQINMHGATYAIWPDIIPASQIVWADQWMQSTFDPFTYSRKKYTVEREPGAFARSLPCYIPIKSKLGDPPVPEERWIDLSPKQRRIYEEIEKEGVAWIEENPMVVDFPTTLHIRLRQIALGEVSVNEDGEVDFPLDCKSPTIDEAKAIMRDHPRKFLLLTDSQKFARAVAHQLQIPEWSGKVSDRDAVNREFLKGDKHLVAVIKAAGESIDGWQEVCHDMIFLSEDQSDMMNRQATGRLWRRGQKHPVNVWVIARAGTVDHGQRSKLIETALNNNRAKLLDRKNSGK